MREYIDLSVLGNWVSMLRADIGGAIWLADDDEEARFYEKCKHAASRIVPAPTLAISLLDLVEDRGIQGVVATVRGPVSAASSRVNVFRPSLGDVASLLLVSKGSDQVIIDLCGAPWFAACKSEVGSVQCKAAWTVLTFDKVRLEVERLGGSFGALGVSNVVRWDTFELDWDRMAEFVGDKGMLTSVEATPKTHCAEDPRVHLSHCDGMDAARVLAAAMSNFHPRGINSQVSVTTESLMGMLRMAFDLQELEDDDVFWQMREWERANGRYVLLKQWRVLDPLGVVWDQRYWEADFRRFFGRIKAYGCLALLKMDLDDFKIVNERLGHSGGDAAIRLYSSTVKRVCGGDAEVYRRGGDEVVVLGPKLGFNRAGEIAEQVRANIEAEFRAFGAKHGLGSSPTASIGVVVTDGSRSEQDVIRLLDDAQLRAKREGKNRVVCISADANSN